MVRRDAVDGARRESPTLTVVVGVISLRHLSPHSSFFGLLPLPFTPTRICMHLQSSRVVSQKKKSPVPVSCHAAFARPRDGRRCAHTLPVDGCTYSTTGRQCRARLCSIHASSQPPVPRCLPGSALTLHKNSHAVFAQKEKKPTHPSNPRGKKKKVKANVVLPADGVYW